VRAESPQASKQLKPAAIQPVGDSANSSAPLKTSPTSNFAPVVSAAQLRRGNNSATSPTTPPTTSSAVPQASSRSATRLKRDAFVQPVQNTTSPASPSPWMKDIHATLAEMNQPGQPTTEETPAAITETTASEPIRREEEVIEVTPVRLELSRSPAAHASEQAAEQAAEQALGKSAGQSNVVHAFRPEAPVAKTPAAQASPSAQASPAAPAHLAPIVSGSAARRAVVKQFQAPQRDERDPREQAQYLTAQIPPPPVLPVKPGPVPGALMGAGGMPVGSPFEVIEESGSVVVHVRRSKLMRTKVDIYRTAVVDEGICEIVQFTPREVSLIGRSVGSTHITFWFDDPAMAPVTYLVKVEPDAEAVKSEEDKYKLLEDVINEMFPDSKIHLLIVANKLIVKGQAKDAEEAAQIMSLITTQSGQRGGNGFGGAGGFGGGLSEGMAAPVLSNEATGGSGNTSRLMVINMLRVPGVQQVALKVKIAELDRTAARGFGVDVRGVVDLGSGANGSKLFLNSILNMATGQNSTLMAQFDGDDIQIGIRYLQQHGVIRLLSEPTLVTMSGTPATFIAGGEFAVPTIVGSAGLNAVTTDFRAFGAIISFMPTVIDKDRIRLQVAPEFSQINSALTVNNTPGLKVRAATTTVEMREGQTLAIAGLLEDNMNGSTVGDLPFVARIFGSRSMSHNETELIILVTPELVHPLDAEEVPPLPGFDVTEPTNGQFYLHGDIEGNPTQDYRSTVWPRLKKRYGSGGPAMTSGPFGHGQ
jgi:pilus assembly protein CpaC